MDSAVMSEVDDAIHQAFPDDLDFRSQSVTIATWDEVGYFREMSDLVSGNKWNEQQRRGGARKWEGTSSG